LRPAPLQPSPLDSFPVVWMVYVGKSRPNSSLSESHRTQYERRFPPFSSFLLTFPRLVFSNPPDALSDKGSPICPSPYFPKQLHRPLPLLTRLRRWPSQLGSPVPSTPLARASRLDESLPEFDFFFYFRRNGLNWSPSPESPTSFAAS